MAESWVAFLFIFLCLAIPSGIATLASASASASSSSSSSSEGSEISSVSRSRGYEHSNVPQVHCSRERSRAAWNIIEEYLMPFAEKEGYRFSSKCRLHPDNDMYRDQEQHKVHRDINEWRCGYCKKIFYEEKYLDKHFDNRHYDQLNASNSRCLADVCGAIHCDLVMESTTLKRKCNPAAVSRNKHLCESLANSCFPVNDGPSARRLHEFFLRQFCDALTCHGNPNPFSRGRKKGRNTLYIVASVVIFAMMGLFYMFLYLYKRGIRGSTQRLTRIKKTRPNKKPA